MIFVRAEQECDWILHLWALHEMFPYFFIIKTHSLCKVQLCLPQIHEKIAWINTGEVYKRRLCPTSLKGSLERYVEGDVYRNNF